MSIDNPLDQVDEIIASDERQQPPALVKTILNLVARLPGAEPLVRAVQYESEKQKVENTELMLATMWTELSRYPSIYKKSARPLNGRKRSNGLL